MDFVFAAQVLGIIFGAFVIFGGITWLGFWIDVDLIGWDQPVVTIIIWAIIAFFFLAWFGENVIS